MYKELKVVIASNRGPVSFLRTDDGFDIKRGAGGLASALDPVARGLGDDAIWIAAATSDSDRDALHKGEVETLRETLGYKVRLLDIDADTYAGYYDDVSNGMLWFANHCLWDEVDVDPPDDPAAWKLYEEVNERFADEIAAVTGPQWLVLFQDYHLTRAPRYLREMRNSNQLMFHFTHSSFCGPGLQRLPESCFHSVIDGMLACDLLGFHTKRWAGSFLDCCEDVGAKVDRSRGLVELGGHGSWVRVYPIPIDTDDLMSRAREAPAQTWAARFLGDGRRKLLVRADRTEPSKNIVRGFQAYGMLLDRRADLVDGSRFIACLYPSRQTMPEYKRYTEEIKTVVESVNDRHPGAIDLFMEDDFDRTLGALEVYDALLVNSLMDGMNLVSKEGPALNERDGVVILSQGAGSFEELGPHVIALDDATDVEATSRAIEKAFDLGAPRRTEMATRLKAAATASRPDDWIGAQLRDLGSLRDAGEPASQF